MAGLLGFRGSETNAQPPSVLEYRCLMQLTFFLEKKVLPDGMEKSGKEKPILGQADAMTSGGIAGASRDSSFRWNDKGGEVTG